MPPVHIDISLAGEFWDVQFVYVVEVGDVEEGVGCDDGELVC